MRLTAAIKRLPVLDAVAAAKTNRGFRLGWFHGCLALAGSAQELAVSGCVGDHHNRDSMPILKNDPSNGGLYIRLIYDIISCLTCGGEEEMRDWHSFVSSLTPAQKEAFDVYLNCVNCQSFDACLAVKQLLRQTDQVSRAHRECSQLVAPSAPIHHRSMTTAFFSPL